MAPVHIAQSIASQISNGLQQRGCEFVPWFDHMLIGAYFLPTVDSKRAVVRNTDKSIHTLHVSMGKHE